jgi:hypothetical protein
MKTEINRWIIFFLIGIPLVIGSFFTINEIFSDPEPWIFVISGLFIGIVSMILATKIIKRK